MFFLSGTIYPITERAVSISWSMPVMIPLCRDTKTCTEVHLSVQIRVKSCFSLSGQEASGVKARGKGKSRLLSTVVEIDSDKGKNFSLLDQRYSDDLLALGDSRDSGEDYAANTFH